jgi:hypothetical protein
MGYDLHITRRADWCDPDSGPPITRQEFERVVLGDPRFRRDEGMGPDFAVLIDPTCASDDAPWLWWQSGEIKSKNPPRSFFNLMFEIATTLSARVVGDDDEEYGPDGRVVEDAGEEAGRVGTPHRGGKPGLVESDADMRTRLRRERLVLILQCSGIAAFLTIFAALLGRQLGWW